MSTSNYNIEVIVSLINTSSIICGILLCISIYILAKCLGCRLDSVSYFFAYAVGTVGFLLTAPVSLLLPIQRKYPDNELKSTCIWAITTLVIFLLACAVGVILMLACKWTRNGSEPEYMINMFISGAFILFASGGIHWLAYRRRHKTL